MRWKVALSDARVVISGHLRQQLALKLLLTIRQKHSPFSFWSHKERSSETCPSPAGYRWKNSSGKNWRDGWKDQETGGGWDTGSREKNYYWLGYPWITSWAYQINSKMKYRSSYGQNLLMHSREVANPLLNYGSWTRLNSKLAKRAGLLHDIGKVPDDEPELPHAILGMKMAEKYKEKTWNMQCDWFSSWWNGNDNSDRSDCSGLRCYLRCTPRRTSWGCWIIY